MPYRVKEIFRSVCGEGHHAGRLAVFVRFAGCNLWSGREEDRASATCPFCDTDFRGGERLSADDIADRALALWPGPVFDAWCVLTGGEPLLQADESLVRALHGVGLHVAVETNGTIPVQIAAEWVTVSPKAGADLVQRGGDELKVVWPQDLDLVRLGRMRFRHFYLQPKDGPDREASVAACLAEIGRNPRWRLSIQAHKYLGLR